MSGAHFCILIFIFLLLDLAWSSRENRSFSKIEKIYKKIAFFIVFLQNKN
jgi:hypothetical protein